MKWNNKTSYWILGVAAVLLLGLGYLQYHWLNEAAEAQKNRIEDQIEAGSRAFSAEFSKQMSDLRDTFQQVVDDDNTEANLKEALAKWKQEAESPEILKSVWVFTKVDTLKTGYELKSRTGNIRTVGTSSVDSLLKKAGQTLSGGLEIKASRIYLGEMSYLMQTSFGQNREWNFPKSFKVSFVDEITEFGKQLENSFLLIELNNQALKRSYLPKTFQELFGDDFESIYKLALYSTNTDDSLFYASSEIDTLARPFRRQLVEEVASKVVFVYNSSKTENRVPPSSGFRFETETQTSNDETETKKNIEISSVVISETSFNLGKKFPEVYDVSTKGLQSNHGNVNVEKVKSGIFLDVFLQAGSINEYIRQTKYLNMGISFLVLLFLGGAIVFVTFSANRGQQLADQQMMFVAGISHELKTPVSVIKSAASNLEDGVISTSEQISEYGAMIGREGDRLNRLIHQVLHMAGIQTDQITINKEDIRVSDLFSSVADDLKAYLGNSGKHLKINFHPDDLTIQADFPAMKLVLTNLIQNAVKYSPNHDEIHLIADQNGAVTRIIIRDFGQGISEHDQKHMFEPFYRGENARRQQIQGNGLGLYLVKQLCSRQNADITIKSMQDVGTTVSIRFGVTS